MNEQWQAFLQQYGASFENGIVSAIADSHVDFPNFDQATTLVDLSHRGLLRISGADNKDFLQGQFCNDVNNVDASHSQLSAYCTPKGRILASFRLFQVGDDYFMSMPTDVLEATLKRLRMFVLRSQVTLEDVTETFVHIGINGVQAEQVLKTQFGQLPTIANEMMNKDQFHCLRIAAKVPRFEIFAPVDDMMSLWKTLSESCQFVASHYWDWLEIRDGLPSITAPVVEAFVPQMVNLHWVDGLSFKKGCYPGQEIVARTHYLGKLKRRMYLAHIDSADCPQAGDELHRRSDSQGQSAGKVVISHPAPEGGCDLLVVMQIDAVDSDEIIANRDTDCILQIRELPYSVETAA